MPYAELTRTGLGRKGAKQIPNAKLVEIENNSIGAPNVQRSTSNDSRADIDNCGHISQPTF
jgi:hypothetical protein